METFGVKLIISGMVIALSGLFALIINDDDVPWLTIVAKSLTIIGSVAAIVGVLVAVWVTPNIVK